MPGEFDIIRQYFDKDINTDQNTVTQGIGDDAAVLKLPVNHELVQSVDTLVSGVHFPHDTSAADIAYKALAVNLSDMAAMGATPAWFTLSLTLPEPDTNWLEQFSVSLFSLAKIYNINLIGGDTTRGPLSVSICINGLVPAGQALLRSTAGAGDKIYVSGTIGDAALALSAWQGQSLLKESDQEYLYKRLTRPTPRVELGQVLRKNASACIDISDGLIADIRHLVDASGVGAKINYRHIPCSTSFLNNMTDPQLAIPLVLSGGDDYELCFTIPADRQQVFENLVTEHELSVSCIGDIDENTGIHCYLDGREIDLIEPGYQHF